MELDVLKQIKIYMIQKDLDNFQAAYQLDMHVNYFRSILNGSMTPGKKTAIKIEDWTGGAVKAHELMGM